MSVSGISAGNSATSVFSRYRPASLTAPTPMTQLLDGADVRVFDYKPTSSEQMRAYLASLHINLAPAPPGRETAPPSPKQAAIDAYTGR